jgi:hypothetical protein
VPEDVVHGVGEVAERLHEVGEGGVAIPVLPLRLGNVLVDGHLREAFLGPQEFEHRAAGIAGE